MGGGGGGDDDDDDDNAGIPVSSSYRILAHDEHRIDRLALNRRADADDAAAGNAVHTVAAVVKRWLRSRNWGRLCGGMRV